MTFHDFFHDLLKFFKTLGELSRSKILKTFLVLGYFWTLHSSKDTNTGVPQNAWHLFCTPLYLKLYLPRHLQ